MRTVMKAVVATCAGYAVLFGPRAIAGNAFVTSFPEKSSTPQSQQPPGGPPAAIPESPAGGNVPTTSQPGSGNAGPKSSGFFKFPEHQMGFGDLAVLPLEDGAEYKINVLNYNLRIGTRKDKTSLDIPFQIYYGDASSDESAKDENTKSLLDPTQGIAIQFPVARLISPSSGICSFASNDGYCVFGADLTMRGVELEVEDAEGESSKKTVFGASVGLRASVLFPIYELLNAGSKGKDGHFGISIGARIYHHQKGGEGIFVDPEMGSAGSIGKRFSALTAEAEFDIYDYIKLRFEYFKPLQDKDVLKRVMKFGVVIAPKKNKE